MCPSPKSQIDNLYSNRVNTNLCALTASTVLESTVTTSVAWKVVPVASYANTHDMLVF
jgi:hypothetical protein